MMDDNPYLATAALLLAFAALLSGCGFNTIPTAEEQAKAAWSEVLNQYQRRADLVLLVVDGNTGQNALVQAKMFHEAVGVTGIVLTKLDGTSKGGIVFAIYKELSIPVKFVGIGEAIEDLRSFDPREFVNALL